MAGLAFAATLTASASVSGFAAGFAIINLQNTNGSALMCRMVNFGFRGRR
jgi:hypothetical protein